MPERDKTARNPCALTRRQVLQLGGAAMAGALTGCPGEAILARDMDAADHVDASGVRPVTPDGGEIIDAAAGDGAAADHGAADRPSHNSALDSGVPAGDPLAPDFLLQLSDIHLGAQDFAEPAFAFCLDHVLPTVAPAALLITGDLVDDGEARDQWRSYRAMTRGAGLNATSTFEVAGNHDAHGNTDLALFTMYSVSGRSGRLPYGHYDLDTGARRLRIVALNTAAGGDVMRNLTGYLVDHEVDAVINGIAEDPAQADVSLVIGHHPADGISGLGILGTDHQLERVLDYTRAPAYLFGHMHIAHLKWRWGALMAQADTVGNPALMSGRPGFNLLAIDDGPVVRSVTLRGDASSVGVDWPLVLITRPASAQLGGANPRTVGLHRASDAQLVRAGVFCPSGDPEQIQVRVDAGPWQDMALTGNHYEARVATPDAASCAIEVRASWSGLDNTDAVQVLLS